MGRDPDVEQFAAYEAFRIGIPAARTTGSSEETLRAAWQAFRAAAGIAQALADRGERAGDSPPLGRMQAVIAALGEALAGAPALPPDHPAPDMVIDPADAPGAARQRPWS